jgi:predicted RNA-binding Zn-ribbon protein involved in translation (DUF1610 family)
MTSAAVPVEHEQFPCQQCGAQLVYEPGTVQMTCPYCGFAQQIAVHTSTVEELPLEHFFNLGTLGYDEEPEQVLHCKSCGAEFTVPENKTTDECPFCGDHVLVEANPEKRIIPNGLLPFIYTEPRARQALAEWLGTRFWAPRNLKKLALKEGRLRGFYVPFWTYDSSTTTDYSGMRGEYYYVTESYTTIENGQSVRRTRQVRRTRWYPCSGTVYVAFDDVLVLGARSLGAAPIDPKTGQSKASRDANYAEAIEEWDLSSMVPYTANFLVGFQTLRYDIDLPRGWEIAKVKMEPRIDSAIRRDIGGDEQRILSHSTIYENNTFKHVLLPIYAGGYNYRAKPYRVVVNGRNGEVRGEAPISFWKVLLAVILGLIVIGVIAYLYMQNQTQGSQPL